MNLWTREEGDQLLFLVVITMNINHCRTGGDPMLEPMNNPNIRVGAD